MEANSTLVFSFRGAVAIVRRAKAGESVIASICSDIASALILFQREGVIPFDEFKNAISFLGELPSDEKLSIFLSKNLTGLIWTEVPYRDFQ